MEEQESKMRWSLRTLRFCNWVQQAPVAGLWLTTIVEYIKHNSIPLSAALQQTRIKYSKLQQPRRVLHSRVCLLVIIEQSLTRNGLEWTARLPERVLYASPVPLSSTSAS